MSKTSPIQLKAHGAALGGGTGVGVAGLVVGLVQQHLTHGPLAPVDVQAIYAAVAVAGAFYGSWLLPLLPRAPAPAPGPEAVPAAPAPVPAPDAPPVPAVTTALPPPAPDTGTPYRP